jgi:hypothetical protein
MFHPQYNSVRKIFIAAAPNALRIFFLCQPVVLRQALVKKIFTPIKNFYACSVLWNEFPIEQFTHETSEPPSREMP